MAEKPRPKFLNQADFARHRGVSRRAVTGWKDKGILVLSPDGKVDVEQTEWALDQRPACYRGGVTHRPVRARDGNNASHAQAKPRPAVQKPDATPPPPPAEEWADEVVEITALAEMIGKAGSIAAKVAVEAGASMEIAFALDRAVCVHLWELADRLIGLPEEPGVSPFEAMVDRRIVEPDWPALADDAGEVVDLDAWGTFADSLPCLQPKSNGEPAPC